MLLFSRILVKGFNILLRSNADFEVFFSIQCGTDQNPCHVKVVGPTIGFGVAVVLAVS